MKTRSPHLLSALCISLCLNACGDDSSNQNSQSCNPECGSDQTCVDGQCKPNSDKTCNPACGSDETCVDGECKPNGDKTCNPACGSDETCVNGECKPNGDKTCNPACGSDETCVNGECKPNGDKTCNPACGSDETCVDGECKPNGDKTCNPACGSDETCVNGECKPNEDTSCNPACGSDETCVDGECKPNEDTSCNPACGSDETCKNGFCLGEGDVICGNRVCKSPKACVDDKCVDVDDGTCDPACTNGKVCREVFCVEGDDGTCGDKVCGDHKTCREGVCVSADDGMCDPECKDGEYCSFGVCLQRCYTEAGVQCGNLCCENEMSVCNKEQHRCERACDSETQVLCGKNAELCCDSATEVCIYGECRKKDPNKSCESAKDCALDAFCDSSVQMCLGEADVPNTCQRDTSNFDFELKAPKWWWPNDLEGGKSKYYPDATNVMAVPLVINMTDDNGDGRINENDIPEVVFPSFTTWPDKSKAALGYSIEATLRAVTTDKNGKLVELAVSDKLYMGLGEIGAADIDNDGMIEVLAATPTEIHALRLVKDETSETGYRWDVPYKLAHGYTRTAYGVPIALSLAPSFADLEGDGVVDIITSFGVLVVKDDGTGTKNLAWKNEACRSNFGPHTATDLDYNPNDIENNRMEIIVAAGKILDADCNPLYTNGVTNYVADWSSGPFVAVADLLKDSDDAATTGELVPEIAVVKDGTFSFYKVYKTLDESGKAIWSIQEKWQHAIPKKTTRNAAGGPPVIADFDGDGQRDVGVAARDYYVVFSNDGTSNGGKVLWTDGATNDASSAMTGSSVFDFQGDGIAEILYADEEELHVYAGPGSETDADNDTYHDAKLVIPPVINSSGTATEYPIVADMDNDGHSEIIVTTNDYGCAFGTHYCTSTGVRVYGDPRWVRTRRIWNQHDYHVTNINEDGTVPRHETPNWTLPNLNNFRQNVQPVAINVAPNLSAQKLSVNYDNCDKSLSLAARFSNTGSLGVTDGMTVSFYIKDADGQGHDALIADVPYTNPVVPGIPVTVDYAWDFKAKLMANATDSDEEKARIEALEPLQIDPHKQTAIYFVVDSSQAIAECDDTDNSTISATTTASCPVIIN